MSKELLEKLQKKRNEFENQKTQLMRAFDQLTGRSVELDEHIKELQEVVEKETADKETASEEVPEVKEVPEGDVTTAIGVEPSLSGQAESPAEIIENTEKKLNE